MTFELDGALMTSRGAAHDYLKQQLQLPDYYGRNLDALFDLLSTLPCPTKIILRNQPLLANSLGSYGDMLVTTLQEAAESNINLEVEIR